MAEKIIEIAFDQGCDPLKQRDLKDLTTVQVGTLAVLYNKSEKSFAFSIIKKDLDSTTEINTPNSSSTPFVRDGDKIKFFTTEGPKELDYNESKILYGRFPNVYILVKNNIPVLKKEITFDQAGLGEIKGLNSVIPFERFYFNKTNNSITKSAPVGTCRYEAVSGNNKCNFTSLAMAMTYAGLEFDKSKAKESGYVSDRLVDQMIERLGRGLNTIGDKTNEYIPDLIVGSQPHEHISNMLIVGNHFAKDFCNISSDIIKLETMYANPDKFRALLKKSVDLQSGMAVSVPVLGVQGYYSNGSETGSASEIKKGGHFVCCSGLKITKEGIVKQLKIDDPWGISPLREGVADGSDGTNGNDVWWVFETFCNEFINNTKRGDVRNSFLVVDMVRTVNGSETNDNTSKLNSGIEYAKVDDFVSRWTCKQAGKDKEHQKMLKIDNYYDFYSGMTPFVELKFRSGVKKEGDNFIATFTGINSIETPFIKSLSVKDNGVKTINVELFDQDFGSMSMGIVSKNNKSFTIDGEKTYNKKGELVSGYVSKGEVISLDELIKTALRTDLEVVEQQKKVKELTDAERSELASKEKFSITTKYKNNIVELTNGKEAYYIKNEYEEAKKTPLNVTYNYTFGIPGINATAQAYKETLKTTIKNKLSITGDLDPSELDNSIETLLKNYVNACNSFLNKYHSSDKEKYTKEKNETTTTTTTPAADGSTEGETVTTTEVIEEYLNFDDGVTKISPTNLRVKFGYCDLNANLKNSGNGGIKELFAGGSTNRWWDFTNGQSEAHKVLTNFEIVKQGGKKIRKDAEDYKIELNNNSAANTDIYKEGKKINEENLASSNHQTRSATRWIDCMITGFCSNLTATGINYSITAIETKEATLMSKRFLQRYTEITSYPEEVLYVLMHCFNENKNELIQGSNVRILLMEDDEEISDESLKQNLEKVNKQLVQQYDSKLLTEEDAGEVTYPDTYNAVLNGEKIKPEALKKITLSLGSERAMENYKEVRDTPPLYKSVASLMNEFCAACPPKKIVKQSEKIYDKQTGEEIVIDKSNQTARPLKWFSVTGIAGEEGNKLEQIYVVLYYRREKKPSTIRIYDWGPQLPYKTCIKNISIQNKGEFALLSGIKTFNTTERKVISRINNKNVSGHHGSPGVSKVEKLLKKETTGSVDLVADSGITADAYDVAISNAVYEGTIEMLGDPFFMFGTYIQPCTYPIRLNVYVPLSECEKSEKPSLSKASITRGNSAKIGNQRLYDYSGYYLVKEIEHNVSSSGFTTKLNVISYPNVEQNIFYNIDKSSGVPFTYEKIIKDDGTNDYIRNDLICT